MEELASRLRRVFAVLAVLLVAVMGFPTDPRLTLELGAGGYQTLVSAVIQHIQATLLPEGVKLIAFNWLDTFYIYFLVSAVIATLLALPYIAYQLYGFIAPALYQHERKYFLAFTATFLGLFTLGALYAYYVLIPLTFTVLYRFVDQTYVMPLYSVRDFFEVIAFGILGTGLFYTFPLVIYMLVVIDLVTVEDLTRIRREFFLAIIILCAIITPDPTPLSMLFMAVPFLALYEGTLLVLRRLLRGRPDRVVEEGRLKALELLGGGGSLGEDLLEE